MRQEKTWKKSSMTSAEDLIITFHGCNAGMPERNKLRMKEMIYDFAIHTLYYENQDIRVPNFSLAIDTLELVLKYKRENYFAYRIFPISSGFRRKCQSS